MPSYNYAAIEIGGAYIDAWSEFRFESDIFTPSDAFRISMGVGSSSALKTQDTIDFLRRFIYPGASVKLYVANGKTHALQATGFVDATDIQNDAGGTKFSVEGRDAASLLIRDAAPIDQYSKDTTIQAFATRACEKHGITVQGSAALNRSRATGKVSKDTKRRLQDQARELGIPAANLSDKIAGAIAAGTITINDVAIASRSDSLDSLKLYQMTAKEAKPQAGETTWEFIERHVKRNGALMRMSVDGKLMLMGIDYDQLPTHDIIRKTTSRRTKVSAKGAVSEWNNVISGGERIDTANVYGRVVVYGRAKGQDATRSAFKGVAENMTGDAVGSNITLILHDSGIRSQAEANKRAEFELAKSRQGMRVLQYTLRGFGQGGILYAPDTVVNVDDDVTGAKGAYYVTSRTFSLSAANGATTELRMVPSGSIALSGAA